MISKRNPLSACLPFLVCTLTLTLTALFYVYDFVIRVTPQAITHLLMADLHTTAIGIGWISSSFFWGYALMQIPSGILLDRFSIRGVLTTAVFLSAAATLGFAMTNHIATACFYRLTMGIGTSVAFVGALLVGARWFQGRFFAMYTGIVQFLGCVGAIIGLAPIHELSINYGWRTSNAIIAIVGLIMMVLIFLLVSSPPTAHKPLTTQKLIANYRAALQSKQTWWVGLFSFATWAPITLFATTWGSSYLSTAFKLPYITANTMISIIWWSIGLSGPIIGWLSRRIGRRCIPMYCCTLIGFASTMVLLYGGAINHSLIKLCLAGIGIGAGGSLVVAFGLVIDLQKKSSAGGMLGFTNTAVVFGGVVFVPVVGYILQRQWDGVLLNGVPVYGVHAFQVALSVLPCCFFLGLVAACFIKETYCKYQH